MEVKQTVLVVDDLVPNVKLLAETLKQNYNILEATSGAEALDIVKTKLPDIILLDVMMPEMDGYAVCTALKSDPATNHIPIIFITAMSDSENEAKGLEAGAVDYITKPFNISLVRARVNNHLVLKQYRDNLETMSMNDGLTGIANRRCFDVILEREWMRMLRNGRPISLIMIDIDFFKMFNDEYGHPAGDECLKNVAKALREELKRPSDILARYGGEEFACILSDTSLEGAHMLANAFSRAVLQLKIPNKQSTVNECVTLSMGVGTIVPGANNSISKLIKGADDLLYEAKRNGRNIIKFSNIF
ncbi:MAG: diguanylate cyclase [Nitrospinae bacterium]|nr:diguanylate cyclase [Nitrospinota bacterium]